MPIWSFCNCVRTWFLFHMYATRGYPLYVVPTPFSTSPGRQDRSTVFILIKLCIRLFNSLSIVMVKALWTFPCSWCCYWERSIWENPFIMQLLFQMFPQPMETMNPLSLLKTFIRTVWWSTNFFSWRYPRSDECNRSAQATHQKWHQQRMSIKVSFPKVVQSFINISLSWSILLDFKPEKSLKLGLILLTRTLE